MNYLCLSQQIYSLENYSIRPIEIQDIESIRIWRNEQMEVLRQKSPISSSEQISYFSQVITPLFSQHQPNQILFSFLKDDSLIGYGGLVHISWVDQRAEMSFLVATDRVNNPLSYEKDMSFFIKLINQVCFERLNFHRLFTETYSFRKHHISILESCGFVYEGTLRGHILEQGIYVDSLLHGILDQEYYEFK